MTNVSLLMILCLLIISLIFIAVVSIFFIIYEINQAESSNDQRNNNEGKIDKRYIERKYKGLIYPLMGTSQYKSVDFNIFFMNRHDVTDIKLPYEFLSPIQTYKNDDDLFTLDIDSSKYDQYLITDAYNDCGVYAMTNLFNWNTSRKYKRSEEHLHDRNYHFITVGHNITNNYEVDKDLLDVYNHSVKTGEGLKELIDKHNLKSKSLMNFYLVLFKKKQPSYNEMIDILIRFEKSLNQIKRIDQVNNSEKINDMLETYVNNDSYQKNNITKIDEDLALLIKNKDILN